MVMTGGWCKWHCFNHIIWGTWPLGIMMWPVFLAENLHGAAFFWCPTGPQRGTSLSRPALVTSLVKGWDACDMQWELLFSTIAMVGSGWIRDLDCRHVPECWEKIPVLTPHQNAELGILTFLGAWMTMPQMDQSILSVFCATELTGWPGDWCHCLYYDYHPPRCRAMIFSTGLEVAHLLAQRWEKSREQRPIFRWRSLRPVPQGKLAVPRHRSPLLESDPWIFRACSAGVFSATSLIFCFQSLGRPAQSIESSCFFGYGSHWVKRVIRQVSRETILVIWRRIVPTCFHCDDSRVCRALPRLGSG